MLVLERRNGEAIYIGENKEITIFVTEAERGKVKLHIDAPKEIPIQRDDIKVGRPKNKA